MTERRGVPPAREGRRGPGGSRRPGRRGGARPRPVADAAAPLTSDSSGSLPRVPGPARSRFTGRAAILVLVVAVLTVSFASSLRAYLQQRTHITQVKEQIAESGATIVALEREKARWEDPAFVQAQARARFGYLMPGERSYVVLDTEGNPLESGAELTDPDAVLREEPVAWWDTAWSSMELAGNPPPPGQGGKPPAAEIDGSTE